MGQIVQGGDNRPAVHLRLVYLLRAMIKTCGVIDEALHRVRNHDALMIEAAAKS